jgi:hypothetical protein
MYLHTSTYKKSSSNTEVLELFALGCDPTLLRVRGEHGGVGLGGGGETCAWRGFDLEAAEAAAFWFHGRMYLRTSLFLHKHRIFDGQVGYKRAVLSKAYSSPK